MSRLTVFDYPPGPHARRHGPQGYEDYSSYRDWLRDEFSFRCVFCLRREQWGRCVSSFHIDHFVPQHCRPDRALDYENLLYVCASCNSVKGDLAVPGPCEFNFAQCLRVLDDGKIHALNSVGESVIALLALNSPDATKYRKLVLDTLRLLSKAEDPATYLAWVQFPDDLPDLSQKRVPHGNSRPHGVAESWHAKRARSKLPEAY